MKKRFSVVALLCLIFGLLSLPLFICLDLGGKLILLTAYILLSTLKWPLGIIVVSMAVLLAITAILTVILPSCLALVSFLMGLITQIKNRRPYAIAIIGMIASLLSAGYGIVFVLLNAFWLACAAGMTVMFALIDLI